MVPNFRWVELSTAVGGPVIGATGLTESGGDYWCIAQVPGVGASALVHLNALLEPVGAYALASTADGHSLIPFDGGLLVTDTLHNRVNHIEVAEDGSGITETVFWSASDESEDVVHLNSIAAIGDDVFVSLFGPRGPTGWLSAMSGMVVHVNQKEPVCTDLYHPHSLQSFDGSLYWLESRRGLIHAYSEAVGHEIVGSARGYLRGLAVTKDYFYVGASAARSRSRSTGTPNVVHSTDWSDFHSWIYRIDRKTLHQERWVLTPFGTEPFDLLGASFSMPSEIPEATSAVVERMSRFELELQGQVEAGQALTREVNGELEAARQRSAETEKEAAALRDALRLGEASRQGLVAEIVSLNAHLEAVRNGRIMRLLRWLRV